MVSEQREREDKFDVEIGFVLPDVQDLLPEGGRLETAAYELENTYVDTADERLRRQKLTLRRRTGGPDWGWHLKVPAGRARTEIRSRSRATTVPKALAAAVHGVALGHELSAVATLSTTRRVLRMLDADGGLLVEIADDQVRSATMGETATLRQWREVEVEVGPVGDEALLEAVGNRLVESGARRSTSVSKVSRALGPVSQAWPDAGRTTLGGLLSRYLRTQVAAIVDGDLGLRLDWPVVHPTRVAIRRLRSTVRIFASAFDLDRSAHLDGELVWFAALLGEVRDRDILRDRLRDQIAAMEAEFVLGPVASSVESALLAERSAHLKRISEALQSERYLALLTELDAWGAAPPFTSEAQRPASKVKKYLARAERKLNKRLRSAEGDVEALHRARKAGKRFRYAAELSEPELGKKAAKTVKAAKKLQKLLGEHQDAVVSAAFLRRLGASAGSGEGHNGFTYGILLSQEWQRAERIRRQLGRRYG